MRILSDFHLPLSGGPGSGKAVQCERMEERFGLRRVTLGDLLCAEPGGSGSGSPIFGAEVTEVVKKLLGGKVPGADEIHPENLKALDVVRLCLLT
uniref:Nucleoside-diphosphate kinase n=1 Tax=Cyprinodon variegatus TaxID=28743 RepID=A0A3Q2D234_CYPVA